MDGNLESVAYNELIRWLDQVAKEFAEKELKDAKLADDPYVREKILEDNQKRELFLKRVYRDLSDTGFQTDEAKDIVDQIGKEEYGFVSELRYKIFALCWMRRTDKADEVEDVTELEKIIEERWISLEWFSKKDLEKIIEAGVALFEYRTNPTEAAYGGYDHR